MPHSLEERKRVVTRLRRIKGQAEALERAVDTGIECADLLQQLAALRGATYGLMADALEIHMRETFGRSARPAGPLDVDAGADVPADPPPDPDAQVDQMARMLRSFLR